MLDIKSGRERDSHDPPTQHFTLIFNTFVMMTLFNEFNARKIHGERNIFSGLLSNHLFYVIWFYAFSVQIVIVKYGGYAFSTTDLSIFQWVISLIFGVGALVWGQILNTIPTEKVIFLAYLRQRKKKIQFRKKDASEPVDIPARIIWVRGVRKVQTQMKVASAFNEKVLQHNQNWIQEAIKDKRDGQQMEPSNRGSEDEQNPSRPREDLRTSPRIDLQEQFESSREPRKERRFSDPNDSSSDRQTR